MADTMELSLQGRRVNYIEQGTGDYVLLLHGWGANIELFRPLIGVLSGRYTVLAPDLPGFGNSEEPETPWCVDDYVDFVIDFLAQFRCRKVILLGHSYGGRIIIKLANRQGLPFSIAKIILVDSAGILPKRSAKSKLRQRCFKLCKGVLSLPPVAKLCPDALENFRKRMGSADYAAASPIMRQTLVRSVNEDLQPLLPGIKPPTLLVWGREDTATPLSDGECMEQLIPGSGLVVLDHAGHYAFLDQQYTFHKVMCSFLEIGE